MLQMDLNTLFSLKGKVALVTGGSRGIGKMIAQGLLQAGAKVYITARKKAACMEAATELSAFGPCFAIPADVGTADGRAELLKAFSKDNDKLHILINNAGTNWGEVLEKYPDEAFEKVLHLNVGAVFSLTRDFVHLLENAATKEDPARVINIGSMDGLHIPTVSRTGTYAYTASKAAVHHLTRNLAVTLGPRQITVNAIAPGFFPSRMTEFIFDKYLPDIKENSLMKRVGKPEEMAAIAIYLCSKGGAYTNGAVIPVDGGTSINHQHVKF
jgi:NAD(P)-dependent dehydrogenase (short-subunit alcohol dehydrogenase family)